MDLEHVLEQTAHARSGYDLVSFQEAGLPVYVMTLRVLVLERKALGPIEEAVLKAVQAGIEAPSNIFAFLGLPQVVLTPVLAGLNTTELINYSRSSADTDAKVTLSAKGRLAIAEAAIIKPQERFPKVCFDALTKKLLFVAPEQLYRSRDMKERGYVEVPTGTSKRPEVEDISLQDFDKVLQRQSAQGDAKCELLAIRRIERRELHFMGCVMLFYRSQSQPDDVEVAFWREDGPAIDHELRFRDLGGPDLVGARLLAQTVGAQSELPIPEVVASVTEADGGPTDSVAQNARVLEKDGANSLSRGASPEVETMQMLLCHEHPAFLKRALTSAKRRLVIVSPWIRDSVVDWPFVKSLEVLLQQGVDVYIGYGIDKADGDGRRTAAKEKPAITPDAEKDLKALAAKFRSFRFVHVGNTHRKSLVCDDEFAVVTSFNWLSYKGDSRGRPRDEHGICFRKKSHVEKVASDVLDLLSKGYSGGGKGGVKS
jgi:hypothetical protein